MKRTRPESLAQIIDQYLRQENLDTQLDQYHACAIWPQIVGPGINRYTVSRDVRNGVMTIRISSAPLRNELNLNRERLIKRINEALGHEVITEIIFK